MTPPRSNTARSIAAGITLLTLSLLAGANGCPGGGILPGGDIGGLSDYVGADVCRGCHRDTHDLWAASAHARALETLRAAGQENNADCLGCHTTAFRAGGFVSAVATPKFGGVQCESCHGPGARHVGTRRPDDLLRVPLTTVCAGCHTEPEQPNFDEWLTTRHATALQSVLDDPAASDACLACHSNDYAVAVRQNEARAARGLPPRPVPSLTDADPSNDPVEGVGCGACHAPHGSSVAPSLRTTPTATCTSCHHDDTTSPGIRPHAPLQNVLTGSGGRQLSASPGAVTSPLNGLSSTHASIDELGGCARCHGIEISNENPTPDTPNETGHRFIVDFRTCTPCHSANVAESLTEAAQDETATRLAELRARADTIDEDGLSNSGRNRLAAAVLNLDLVDRDGSIGVHNRAYAAALLDAAEDLIDDVEATP